MLHGGRDTDCWVFLTAGLASLLAPHDDSDPFVASAAFDGILAVPSYSVNVYT